jgi:hypothetical protein
MNKIKLFLIVTNFLIFPTIAFSLTNADLLNLRSAGMTEEILLSAVQADNNPQFDVSADGLISLKKAGVTDAVLTAILSRAKKDQTSGSTNTAGITTAQMPDGVALNRNSMLTPKRLLAITEKGATDLVVEYYSARPTFKTLLFKGLGGEETLSFRPVKSSIRVTNKPIFEASLEPNLNPATSLVLVKYEIDETLGARTTSMIKNRNGFKQEIVIPFDFEEITTNGRTDGARKIWKFTPKDKLVAGEYGIYLDKNFHGFGID